MSKIVYVPQQQLQKVEESVSPAIVHVVEESSTEQKFFRNFLCHIPSFSLTGNVAIDIFAIASCVIFLVASFVVGEDTSTTEEKILRELREMNNRDSWL